MLKEFSRFLDTEFSTRRALSSTDQSAADDLYVIDYVYFFVQALEAEITDRHPFLVEAIDQVQPIAETFMFTFANATQVGIVPVRLTLLPNLFSP